MQFYFISNSWITVDLSYFMIQTNLVVSSAHSHVSGNSLRTRSSFFVEDSFFDPVEVIGSGSDRSSSTWRAEISGSHVQAV